MSEKSANGDPSTKWKIVKTVFLVLVWVTIGLFTEITGPTLIDLKLRTHTNYEGVASAVSGRSVGFFIGSALGGVLVDKLGLYCDLMLAICLDLAAAVTIAVPWAPVTGLLFFLTLCQGTFEGVINVSGQKLILNMWKERAASPLHILHGGFGIGSFIIPLVSNPFLAELVPDPEDNNTLTKYNYTTSSFVTTLSTTTTADEDMEPQYIKQSKIEFAYMIAAAITVTVSLIFFGYHFTGRNERARRLRLQQDADIHVPETKKGQEITTEQEGKTLSFKEMFNPATCANGNLLYGLVIFILVFLFFIQAVGGERVGGKFIRAFAIDHYGFSNDEGSYINTVFWIVFTVGRVTGFIAARWIPIRILILLETGGGLVVSILLVIIGGGNRTALWVLMPMMGFFVAPLFPSGLGWANFHIEVTGVAITVFMLGGSLGGVIYMQIIGFLYENYGTLTFLYTLLGYSIAAFTLAILMDIVGARGGNRFTKDETDKHTEQIETVEPPFAINNQSEKNIETKDERF